MISSEAKSSVIPAFYIQSNSVNTVNEGPIIKVSVLTWYPYLGRLNLEKM